MKTKGFSDGLLGMWGHDVSEDGDIIHQFQIVRGSRDMYVCQLWEGRGQGAKSTFCIAMTRNKVLGLKLYESPQAMDRAFELYRAQRRWRQQGEHLSLVGAG